MKVVDAIWEKRNLGVDCREIKIEKDDTIEEIKRELPQNESQYTVVKVPSGKFDVIFLLQEMGYTYVESSINLTHDLKDIKLNPIQQRIMDSLSYSRMGKDDIEKLFCEIKKGVFSTDRIYIDPHFTHEQAANRYINWISDELDKSTEAFKITHKDKSVGFFTFKDIGNSTCYPFLAGMYSDYLKSGLGMSTIEKPLKEAVKRKYKQCSTFISSNNVGTLNMHIAYRFKFESIDSVYIKHLI